MYRIPIQLQPELEGTTRWLRLEFTDCTRAALDARQSFGDCSLPARFSKGPIDIARRVLYQIDFENSASHYEKPA